MSQAEYGRMAFRVLLLCLTSSCTASSVPSMILLRTFECLVLMYQDQTVKAPPGIWLVLVSQNELALTSAGCYKTRLSLIFGLFCIWPFSFCFSTMLGKKQAGLCHDSGACMVLSLQICELSKRLFFIKHSTSNNWLYQPRMNVPRKLAC